MTLQKKVCFLLQMLLCQYDNLEGMKQRAEDYANNVNVTPLSQRTIRKELTLRKLITFQLITDEEATPPLMLNYTNYGMQTKSHFLQIHLDDVWQEYQVTYNYNFTTPKINAHCTNRSRSPDLWYNEFESKCQRDKNKRCYRRHFPWPASCIVSITPDTNNLYYAFYFELPKTYYKISFSLLDAQLQPIVSRSFQSASPSIEVPINEIGAKLKVDSYPTTSPVISKWGFIDRRHPEEIKTNLWMNPPQIGEYRANLNDLGWYQLDRNGDVIPLPPHVVWTAFDAYFDNDDENNNNFQWNFNAYGCNNGFCEIAEADTLQDVYASEIEKVELYGDKNVIVRRRSNPPLRISVNFH